MTVSDVRRLKDLESENAKLKKLLAESELLLSLIFITLRPRMYLKLESMRAPGPRPGSSRSRPRVRADWAPGVAGSQRIHRRLVHLQSADAKGRCLAGAPFQTGVATEHIAALPVAIRAAQGRIESVIVPVLRRDQPARSRSDMTSPPDPRVLFAAERTLLAWQRSSLALMGFGFVIERFSLFISVLRRESGNATHHYFSLFAGVLLILLGAGVALASSYGYRHFLRALPRRDVSSGFLVTFGAILNIIIAALGIALAGYLLATEL